MSGLPLDALFEALANGLWRGSVLAIVTWILLHFVIKTTAAERYAIWLAVLTAVALAPIAEVLLTPERPTASPVEATATAANGTTAISPSPMETPPRLQSFVLSAAPFLWLWSLVGLALAVRLVRRCWLAAKLKANASLPRDDLAAALRQWESRLAACRVGRTRVTESLRSPAAVGWFEPSVLLPDDSRPSDDLEMLWLHEQAHVSRFDDWTQLLCECLLALSWFHPATYWVRRELERARELACDETVVNSGIEAGRYAGALGRWAVRAAENELPVEVMGLGRSEASIIRRIEMLLSPSRVLRCKGVRWTFAGSLAVALGATILLSISTPQVIRAQVFDVHVQPVTVEEQPVPVESPQVSIAPVLLVQAPPPTPPTPVSPPKTNAPTAPAPPVPPVSPDDDREQRAKAMAERTKRLRERLGPQVEAIREEARRIQKQVLAEMAPQQERIQQLAKTIARKHAESLQPLAKEMAELAAKIAVASALERTALAAQMEVLSKQMAVKEPELQRLEEQILRIQDDLQPSLDVRLEGLRESLQKKTETFEEAQREFQQSLEESLENR